MAKRRRIIYIRGYAMTESEVENTLNQPYYGFNLGSTLVRQDRDEKPFMRIFESSVVRLIKEHNYVDSFNRFVDARNTPIKDSVDDVDWHERMWIFRFYDRESQLLGQNREEIEDDTAHLAIFLDQVRGACGDPKDFGS